jgi:hypothetical protein
MDLLEKERNLDHIPVTWHCYVISLMLSLPVMKSMQRRKYGRMSYQSIIKNDVWVVVPRLKEKSIVSSRWIYKMTHSSDGSMEKYKEYLWLISSPRKKE